MEGLAYLFFILSPFALFCTEGGTGLIMCPIFVLLGFLFKYLGKNNGVENVKRVEPSDWWEEHYKIYLAQNRGEDVAWDLADYTTRSNGFPMPSESKKESIARSMGVVTEKMKQQERDKWDRVQVGKYYLMQKLIEKYGMTKILEKECSSPTGKKRFFSPWRFMKDSVNSLEFALDGKVHEYSISRKYKKTTEEVWISLNVNERNEAQQWIKEYEERMLKEADDYVNRGIPAPTIEMHTHVPKNIYDLNIKYGFARRY